VALIAQNLFLLFHTIPLEHQDTNYLTCVERDYNLIQCSETLAP